ncbi:unnamed protein product [Merluccius merluccius]
MGIEEEADRTLFIRNLDQRVSEEILFELFLQAGPLCKTKIPRDGDGKQKTFGFAVYRHEVSVPYAMQLLHGTTLFGKTIGVQFRSGSSHSNSPAKSQNTSPGTTPNPHGLITPVQLNSPPYTPPPQMQRSYASPDSLQKQVMMNNMMWQLHMQQIQLNGGLAGPPQRNQPSGGAPGGLGGSRQPDNSAHWQRSSQYGGGNDNSSHHGRSQRYTDEPTSSRHQQISHGRDNYRSNDRRTGRHHDNDGGGSRPYDTNWGGNRGYQDVGPEEEPQQQQQQRDAMHCQAELRLASPGRLKAARRRYKTFMIDEILSRETCDYFEKLSLYSVCPSLVVRPKPLHSCPVMPLSQQGPLKLRGACQDIRGLGGKGG